MPEINLPTKATQDAIKQDTTQILSQFPISGGTDFFSMTPISKVTSNNINTQNGNEYTLASIQGKGIITDIQVTASQPSILFFVVDGVEILTTPSKTQEDSVYTPSNYRWSNSSTSQYRNFQTGMIPFQESFVVKFKATGSYSPIMYTTAISCLLD